MAEQLCNRASTFLAGAITTTGQTTITVTGSSQFPSGAQFRILIANEIMIVTSGGSSTTTWTVTRGAEGSTATTHALGERVYAVLTAAGLDAYIRQVVASMI